ncbi:MAG: hypothetical protein RR397_10775 [Odoribacter sp.]
MNKIRGKRSLEEQNFEVIRSHIVDPEHSELPAELQPQFKRVVQAARLLDDYPNDSHIQNIMLTKYSVTRTQVRKDIALAREMFKSCHTFDWDFWFTWQLKDQVELIRQAKLRGDLKQWNQAKRTLREMIGDKPVALEDPRRVEKNVFYIQVNHAGSTFNVDLDAIKKLPQDDRSIVMEALYEPIDDAQAEELMNT